MAHLRCDFRSDAMGMNTSMTVILPDVPESSRSYSRSSPETPTASPASFNAVLPI